MTLTQIFIALESDWGGFSAQKQGDLQKKKKKVFTEIEPDFSAEIKHSNGFSAQKQVISKKKVFTEIETDFSAEITHSNGSSGRITAIPSQLRLPNPFGGLFSFLEQQSISKALKSCNFAYFSGQWEGWSPPSGYATDRLAVMAYLVLRTKKSDLSITYIRAKIEKFWF